MIHEDLGFLRISLHKAIGLTKCIKLLLQVERDTIHRKEDVGKILKLFSCNWLKKEECGSDKMVVEFLEEKLTYQK